jgi:hypothetical protein
MGARAGDRGGDAWTIFSEGPAGPAARYGTGPHARALELEEGGEKGDAEAENGRSSPPSQNGYGFFCAEPAGFGPAV